MVQYFRLVGLALLLSLGMGNLGSADEVDEAAKCSATFRILTSLELQNEALGQHFTKLALFSYDLMGLYSQIYRNKNMTNGQTSELITDFQLILDAASNDGSAFLPYVKSCTGWLVKVGTLMNEADREKNDVKTILAAAPTPNLSFRYPHSDWSSMKNMFLVSYGVWSDMGKITPRDIRKALGN
jgi:hypothetical protein